jgi:cellulose synthase/poly-beta-1,6-N-acetylglucosamine synthase-like glycosyltransferase
MMTTSLILLFWLCVGLVAYAYAGYPLMVALISRRFGCDPWQANPADDDACPPLTVVVAAYDEEARIAARIADILAQDYPPERLHVLVVSDGSRDRTAEVAAAAAIDDSRVVVLDLPVNGGKAAALNAAMAQVMTDIVVFTDARQTFGSGALRALVVGFADPDVGAVSGELVIDNAVVASADGSADAPQAVGLYWRMEKRLRGDEARLGWLHGVSGAIYALRRDLFRPLPPGTILDDMWVPLHVALAGRWVWMARDAIAHDHISASAREEFSRKLRTLAGNWQLLARLPVLLHPSRNPVFLAWFSHKFLRLMVPWALLLALLASALVPHPFYRFAFYAQLLCYLWAAIGLQLPRLAARMPLSPAAGTFVMLNAAALLSLPASLAPDASRLWKKH